MTINSKDYVLIDSQNANGVGSQTATRIYGTTANTSNVTQLTSRTTGVTINAPVGTITLHSEAGTGTWQTFTVTNSFVSANDVIYVGTQPTTDLYAFIPSNIQNGSFTLSVIDIGGTTVEAPVLNFVVFKSAVV